MDQTACAARAILTVAEIAELDRRALARGDLSMLVERAGAAVAGAIVARWPVRPVLALCGPGHNGADGFVVARLLREAGWPVRLALLGDPAALNGAVAGAAERWGGPVLPLDAVRPDGSELVVDALYGAGLSRPVSAPAAALLAAGAGPVVAVDLPSGLQGDTGAPLGSVRPAELTVTFHRLKPAHVLQPGRRLCGGLVVADIGLVAPAAPRLFENGPPLWLSDVPWPRVDAHKADRGRLVVMSGPAWTTGAARLSARSGLRVGAGLVTLLSPPDALAVNAAHLEAVMLHPAPDAGAVEAAAAHARAAVIGPAAGVGPATHANVQALARTDAALVVDADALTSFRQAPRELFHLLGPDDVLTPHPGEFERVFPGLLAEAPERISAAREAARRAGAVVLLKGADTVVAAPDGRAVVNTNGAPWLATAGSGDVLAGLIGGLVAQGMASFEAACAAAWIHAQAGARFGPGLISEDLPEQVPAVLAGLYARRAG